MVRFLFVTFFFLADQCRANAITERRRLDVLAPG
jgi:hypothetical protein